MSRKVFSRISYESKEAKIVKLNPIKQMCTSINVPKSTPNKIAHRKNVFDSSVSSVNSTEKSFDSLDIETHTDVDNLDPIPQYITKLYIIKDYIPELLFGDLMVKKGQLVYLLANSNRHCLVENEKGEQGFVPKEICLDLEETMRKAQQKNRISSCKVTSL